MNQKKVKELRKRIKPLQVEWLKTLLPDEQSDSITVDNVSELIPEQTHVFGSGTLYLSFMSDKWIMKMLKKYPDVSNYEELEAIHMKNQERIARQGEDQWTNL